MRFEKLIAIMYFRKKIVEKRECKLAHRVEVV